jgi:hypothetical protein
MICMSKISAIEMLSLRNNLSRPEYILATLANS